MSNYVEISETNANKSVLSIKERLKQYSKSDYSLFFLYSLLLIPCFEGLLKAIEVRIGLASYTDILSSVWVVLAVLLGLPKIISKLKWKHLLFYITVAIVYCISPLFYPQTSKDVQDGAEVFLLQCLPFYFVGLSIDTKKYKNVFNILAKVAVLVTFLFMYSSSIGKTASFGGDEETGENMYSAYMLLPWVLVLLWRSLEEHKWLDILFAVFSTYLLFSLGSRGPIVCLISFLTFYLIVFKKYKYNVLTKAAIITFFFILYFHIEEILVLIVGGNYDLGFSTRLLDNFLEEGIIGLNNSSGRDDIYELIINAIQNDNKGLGYGLFSDRHFAGIWSHAHNLELEVVCHFGKIIGGALLLSLFLFVYKTFKLTWKTESVLFVSIYFFSSVIMLQYSMSYLISFHLWLFLGICESARQTVELQ